MALTAGERVTLITRIASALAERPYSETDLILDQFGFPTSDRWEGDAHSYVVAHIKAGDETDLLALHGYLFPGEAPSAPGSKSREEAAGGIWESGYFRLFISHSSKQKIEIGEFKVALRQYGIDAFVAHDDIEPTKEWQDVIETALHTCEAFTAYLTLDFQPSDWCDQEVGVALARGILIIPIRKGKNPYGFMGKYQALPGANKHPPRLAEDIAEILRSNGLTAERFSEAERVVLPIQAVEAIEAADTYNEARAAFSMLEAIPRDHFPEELVKRIEKACQNNGQLSAQWAWGSTTVAEEAQKIVAEIRESDDDDMPF
jgi:hypothetical protein